MAKWYAPTDGNAGISMSKALKKLFRDTPYMLRADQMYMFAVTFKAVMSKLFSVD